MMDAKEREAVHKALCAWFKSQDIDLGNSNIVCIDFVWMTLIGLADGDRDKLTTGVAALITDLVRNLESIDD